MSDLLAGKKNTALRITVLIILLVTLVLLGHFTALGQYFDRHLLQTKMEQLGYLGFIFYIGAFTAGVLLNIPGLLFVAIAALVYGKLSGAALAVVGAIFATTASFVMVRSIGGRALGEIQSPWVQRILARLEKQPIITVILLRLLVVVSPPVTYALALSNIRFKDYFIGTCIGLAPVIFFIIFVFDFLIIKFS